jgi:hypothetical protein
MQGRSLMYIKKINDPSIEPWGTPALFTYTIWTYNIYDIYIYVIHNRNDKFL